MKRFRTNIESFGWLHLSRTIYCWRRENKDQVSFARWTAAECIYCVTSRYKKSGERWFWSDNECIKTGELATGGNIRKEGGGERLWPEAVGAASNQQRLHGRNTIVLSWSAACAISAAPGCGIKNKKERRCIYRRGWTTTTTTTPIFHILVVVILRRLIILPDCSSTDITRRAIRFEQLY